MFFSPGQRSKGETMTNRDSDNDLMRDLIGFLVVGGMVGGPALLVAWVIFKLAMAIMF
jgi:hypothetical protein